MVEEKLIAEQIKNLVEILNNPENKKIIQTQREFSTYANDWYIQKMRESSYF